MTIEANAKLADGPMRKKTTDELRLETEAVVDIRRRARRVIHREIDRDSPVDQAARLVAVLDHILDEAVDEYTDRYEDRLRRDTRGVELNVDDIPF